MTQLFEHARTSTKCGGQGTIAIGEGALALPSSCVRGGAKQRRRHAAAKFILTAQETLSGKILQKISSGGYRIHRQQARTIRYRVLPRKQQLKFHAGRDLRNPSTGPLGHPAVSAA